MELALWVVGVVAGLLVVGWYLSMAAARLDRLHHRVESSWAAVEVQLSRRAALAAQAAAVLPVDDASGLAEAAGEALGIGGRGRPMEAVQNDLTRALHRAFDQPLPAGEATAELAEACHRLQLARRFHNDAVAQAQRVRRKRVVRWARLAGHAPAPSMLEIDDSVPAGLSP